MKFDEKIRDYADLINGYLEGLFSAEDCLQKSVYDAMRYSVLAGGKRLRPILTLAAAEMLGGDMDDALRIGSSIECIHTYSLLHDDLPCMDDDDLRRGMPTCHKKFGEATALLAGDGLLTAAFELLTDFTQYKTISPETVLEITTEIAKAAGCRGMIGGQVVDLESEGKSNVNEETLTYIHNRKTGALIRVSVLAGAIVAGASSDQLSALTKFADAIGFAFQIQDDILDCIGDEKALGKPIGSDVENEKNTYVTLFGLNEAQIRVEKLTQNAISALALFGDRADFLREFATSLINRKK